MSRLIKAYYSTTYFSLVIKFFALILLSTTYAISGDLDDSMNISAAGMRVQSERMKIIAQNIANSNSTGNTPGADPYRRKTISFRNVYDRKKGIEIITVDKRGTDYKTPFEMVYDPGHPAADEGGYVKIPNIKKAIETMDMREAERSYEANLSSVETSKEMYTSTIDLLR